MKEETEPFIIDEFMRIQMAPYRYLIALEESRERRERAEDFVRRYPYIVRVKRLSMLSQAHIVLPPQKSAIPGKKRR